MGNKAADAEDATRQQSGDLDSDADDADSDAKNEIDETIVGKGIGNALKVLRDRGLLGKHALVRGRNTDRTLETQLQAFDKDKVTAGSQETDRVKLKYLDKRGRELTIKEAYR